MIPTTQVKQKPHLSHTQIEMHCRCGEAYRRRYVEGEVIPPGIALLEGKAVHGGAEVNFRQKMESHMDLPEQDIVDAAVAKFETERAGGYCLTAEEEARGASVVLGEAKDTTAALARLHAKEQAPAYQPVAVEHSTRIVLPHATHDLLAITDLRDDQGRIVDLKTAKKSPPQSDVDRSMQLTIYAAANMVDTGSLPFEVRLDVLVKNKAPKRVVLSSTRTMTDIDVLANRMNATLNAISKGVFTPAPVGAWNCSPRWCGYWATCPYINSKRVACNEGE
jgi:hypothetical protein